MPSELEIQLDKFLGFGVYQLFVYLVVQFSILSSCINMTFMSFGGYKPKWTCDDDFDSINSNYSFDSISSSNQTPTDSCKVYNQCTNVTFHTQFWSIIPEVQNSSRLFS